MSNVWVFWRHEKHIPRYAAQFPFGPHLIYVVVDIYLTESLETFWTMFFLLNWFCEVMYNINVLSLFTHKHKMTPTLRQMVADIIREHVHRKQWMRHANHHTFIYFWFSGLCETPNITILQTYANLCDPDPMWIVSDSASTAYSTMLSRTTRLRIVFICCPWSWPQHTHKNAMY